MTTTQIQALIETTHDNGKMGTWGLRSVSASDPIEVGSSVANSAVWADGERQGSQLPGVCAITLGWGSDIDADLIDAQIQKLNGYLGDRIALLFCHQSEFGEDEGEIVMIDAEVFAIWNK